jgi:hypothetical protein
MTKLGKDKQVPKDLLDLNQQPLAITIKEQIGKRHPQFLKQASMKNHEF